MWPATLRGLEVVPSQGLTSHQEVTAQQFDRGRLGLEVIADLISPGLPPYHAPHREPIVKRDRQTEREMMMMHALVDLKIFYFDFKNFSKKKKPLSVCLMERC